MGAEDLFKRIDDKLSRSEFRGLVTEAAHQLVADSRETTGGKPIPSPKAGPVFSNDTPHDDFDSFDDESSISEYAWVERLRQTPTLTSAEHINLARCIEVGVMAQGSLTGSFPRASQWRVSDLHELVRLGDLARQKMIEANLGLVLYWAQRTRQQRDYSLEDRFQDGCIGLMRAIEGWDFLRGYEFSTYATWHIRQQIGRRMNDSAYTVRIPIHVQEQWNSSRRSGGELDELAQSARLLTTSMVSLESVKEFDYEEKDPLQEQYLDQIVDGLAVSQVLDLCIEDLAANQFRVLRERFGLNNSASKPLAEIGKDLGLSRQRIKQIEKKTVERASVKFWCRQPWFIAGIAGQFEMFRMGETLAHLICADPFAKCAQLSRDLGVSSKKIHRIQEFIYEMAKRANQILDPLSEIPNAPWPLLMAFPLSDDEDDD